MSIRTACTQLALGLLTGLFALTGGCGGGINTTDGPQDWDCRDGACVCEDDERCAIECFEVPCGVDCSGTNDCDATCDDLCTFDCTASDQCDVQCDADCEVECRSNSDCAATCGERCDYSCESAGACSVVAGPDSDIRCASFGSCRVECLGSCRVDCAQGGCDITCRLGSPEDAGGGQWVCPG